MAVEHVVKCWPEYFDAIDRGEKPFDVRRDDWGYQKGDTLKFQKYKIGQGFISPPNGGRFSIHEIRREITYVLTGGQFGIEPGHVVLGLKDVSLSEPSS